MKALARGAAMALPAIGRLLASPQVWFFLLAAVGVCAMLSGIFLLAGTPWAMVAGGAIALCAALLVLIGMARGG